MANEQTFDHLMGLADPLTSHPPKVPQAINYFSKDYLFDQPTENDSNKVMIQKLSNICATIMKGESVAMHLDDHLSLFPADIQAMKNMSLKERTAFELWKKGVELPVIDWEKAVLCGEEAKPEWWKELGDDVSNLGGAVKQEGDGDVDAVTASSGDVGDGENTVGGVDDSSDFDPDNMEGVESISESGTSEHDRSISFGNPKDDADENHFEMLSIDRYSEPALLKALQIVYANPSITEENRMWVVAACPSLLPLLFAVDRVLRAHRFLGTSHRDEEVAEMEMIVDNMKRMDVEAMEYKVVDEMVRTVDSRIGKLEEELAMLKDKAAILQQRCFMVEGGRMRVPSRVCR